MSYTGSLVVLLIVFAAVRAEAQQPSPPSNPTEGEIVFLEENERAPFSGMFFPTETAVRWRQRIELLQERLRLDVERCEQIADLRLRLAEDTLRVRTEQYDSDREMLRESIARASGREWYEQPVLWLVIGIVLGAGAAVLLAAAIAETL